MENWDNNNLPERHKLLTNFKLMAITKGTWNRRKQDGTSEVAEKWQMISEPDENGDNHEVGVYSSTDKESLKMGEVYDLIVKEAVGKDGTFYGYSLKGYGKAGEPIPKKETQSRFQKGLKQNNKAIALQASATYNMYESESRTPDDVIDVAEVFLAWLEGSYEAPSVDKKS